MKMSVSNLKGIAKNNTTKRVVTVFFVFMMVICLLPETAFAATVKLNKTKATVYVGKTVKLSVKGTKKKAKWSTSNKKIATVNKAGKVTAKKKGTATITVKVGKKAYKCKLTVKNVQMNKTKATLYVGKTMKLAVNGAKKKAKWSTSNKKIAIVDKKGKVTAKKAGTVTIKAKIGKKTYKCKLTVKKLDKGSVEALKKAKELLKKDFYSYEDLKQKLIKEYKYTNNQAKYAVDNCGANWNKQAIGFAKYWLKKIKAKNLLGKEVLLYSYNSIEKYMTVTHDFTKKQATYALKNINIDWNKQALAAAKYALKVNFHSAEFGEDYQYDYTANEYVLVKHYFSYAILKKCLVNEFGFTDKQAKYGVDNCGADWNKNALNESVNSWGEVITAGIIRSYLSDDCLFRESEVKYAIEHIDWGKKAEGNIVYMSSEYDKHDVAAYNDIYKRLLGDGFTDAQIRYGFEHCGINWEM